MCKSIALDRITFSFIYFLFVFGVTHVRVYEREADDGATQQTINYQINFSIP